MTILIPDRDTLLAISGAFVVVLAWLREPFDVERGDPAWKSLVDFASWIIGVVISYFALSALGRDL